ncbi:hypothetical protein [Marinobacter bohaiensis]|uniref:hypothetical protein n=1 Tax=Marinobacter bohaiensis TaxID=2201898 RepID=UPI000DABE99A|nr:hypothetical protein [Marinobacter bohaiensis]
MRSVLHDHDVVRLIKDETNASETLYRVEVEGEGTLYSAASFDAALHYLDMLMHPLIVEPAA